ncbi:hypothetical protein PanWU01x14_160300 [Parasponia andersonii]|uniref:Uncharacterized protein n=1 Tax=Parasponia andersonii TaxID=3476 RepID=A0A2P5CE37_PARAD|nr:hypothetical protein PanWU01x14_160300 [Parasponia andersonii]
MGPEGVSQDLKESSIARGRAARPKEKPCDPRSRRKTQREALRPEVVSQNPRGRLATQGCTARPEGELADLRVSRPTNRM